jgi:hypothetical protein
MAGNSPVTTHWERKHMATVSKLVLGAVIAVASIASPAFAQQSSKSDPSISSHHSKYLKKSSQRNGTDAFASQPYRGADPGAKPYHFGGAGS